MDGGYPGEVATDEREEELWSLFARTGDVGARSSIAELYLPLVRRLAANLYARRPDNDVPFEDYFHWGTVGLMEALDRFESGKGASFATFSAYRIKGAILSGVEKATEKREWLAPKNRASRGRIESVCRSGDLPHCDTFEDIVHATIGLAIGYLLDGPGRADASAAIDQPYSSRAVEQTRARLAQMVDALPERERVVVSYHYYHQMDFEEIADILCLSKGRISQLHKSALAAIRARLAEEFDGEF